MPLQLANCPGRILQMEWKNLKINKIFHNLRNWKKNHQVKCDGERMKRDKLREREKSFGKRKSTTEIPWKPTEGRVTCRRRYFSFPNWSTSQQCQSCVAVVHPNTQMQMFECCLCGWNPSQKVFEFIWNSYQQQQLVFFPSVVISFGSLCGGLITAIIDN